MKLGIKPKKEFRLKDSFVEQYKNKQPSFGPLGLITYKRTYARPKADGTTEEFWETVERVVNGIYTIQKNHYHENSLPFNEESKEKQAEHMYDAIWNFKFTPPGRGLTK